MAASMVRVRVGRACCTARLARFVSGPDAGLASGSTAGRWRQCGTLWRRIACGRHNAPAFDTSSPRTQALTAARGAQASGKATLTGLFVHFGGPSAAVVAGGSSPRPMSLCRAGPPRRRGAFRLGAPSVSRLPRKAEFDRSASYSVHDLYQAFFLVKRPNIPFGGPLSDPSSFSVKSVLSRSQVRVTIFPF